MNKIYLLIGGNLGNRFENIEKAAALLEQQVGKIIGRSSIYETDAWGNPDQPDFLNQVLVTETKLSAMACMQQIFSIEAEIGRVRAQKNDPRSIDIDILFFNSEIINEPQLTVPHPQIQHRRFVLIPMSELAAGFIHPVLNRDISHLLTICTDKLEVRRVSRP